MTWDREAIARHRKHSSPHYERGVAERMAQTRQDSSHGGRDLAVIEPRDVVMPVAVTPHTEKMRETLEEIIRRGLEVIQSGEIKVTPSITLQAMELWMRWFPPANDANIKKTLVVLGVVENGGTKKGALSGVEGVSGEKQEAS